MNFAFLDFEQPIAELASTHVRKTLREWAKEKLGLGETTSEHNRKLLTAYLDGLTWDQEKRLDTWLATYAGTEDTAYTVSATDLVNGFSDVDGDSLSVTALSADHGTAAPQFVMGGSVKGGLHGVYPSLGDLQDGDLKHTVDFTQIHVVKVEAEKRAREEIDALIADTAERWRPERMAVLDRLILRMAVCELLRGRGTPPAVVINEALELARTFSTEDAVKFINGMLDGIRKKIDQ